MRQISASRLYLWMAFLRTLAGSTIFTTYSIYYVKTLELNPLELVLIGTVLEGTVLLFEGITGIVADTYSRKNSVIIGMFILGGAFTLEGSILWLPHTGLPAVAWVMAAQILYGLGWTFVSGADIAWIVDEAGEQQAGNLFLRAQKLALLASLLGIPCSVGLSLAAPNLPFLAGGGIYLLLGLLLASLMPETGFVRRLREERSPVIREMRRTLSAGVVQLRRTPLLLLLVLVTLLGGASSEGYDRLWQIYLIEETGFPDTVLSLAVWFGMISAAATLLGILGVHVAERRIDMNRERALPAWLLGLTSLRIGCLILLAWAPGFAWALTSILLMGALQNVAGPVYSVWLSRKLESGSRATVLSMVSGADALGQTAGGPAVGWIGSRFSIRASLLAAAVLLVPVAALYQRVLRRDK